MRAERQCKNSMAGDRKASVIVRVDSTHVRDQDAKMSKMIHRVHRVHWVIFTILGILTRVVDRTAKKLKRRGRGGEKRSWRNDLCQKLRKVTTITTYDSMLAK